MRKLNQTGSLLVPFIIVFLFFLGTVGFAAWAFLGMQDYKNNSDQKSAQAVKKAVVIEDVKKEAAFAETEKLPVKTYKGSATFGSLTFAYPKTWSAYISETGTGTSPINGYMNPNYVPDILNSGTAFALRFQVINTAYPQLLKSYDSLVTTGKAVVAPYAAAKQPKTLGSIITGTPDYARPNVNQIIVILPIRDKTIQIWTEGPEHVEDFYKIILPSLNFEP